LKVERTAKALYNKVNSENGGRMESIVFACPHCEKKVEMTEDRIGHTVKCPHCSRQITVMQDPSESLKSPIIRQQLDGTMFKDRRVSLICWIAVAAILAIIFLAVFSRFGG